ncbi:endonuclease/exonuclease/phosphatase family protein, partial [Trifolium medium]|nr:endonuclease/exonuclease/phosphatase family protein [Trifolium medium]
MPLGLGRRGGVELGWSGRKFTWYRGDGVAMSRLDRFLITEEWSLSFPNCIQTALPRTLSDHCPITLCIDEQNWGPRPLRMLKVWTDIPG